MIFSQDFIAKVSEANDIVQLISEFTQLEKKGADRYLGLCPFHSEKTPSFSVSQAKQVYHCFGCKKSGNIYNFLQEIKGLHFVDTVELLAEKAGIPLPKTSEKKQDNKRKDYLKINSLAVEFYKKSLQKAPTQVTNYLKSRHLDKVAKEFDLGWANDSWDSLCNVLKKEKISLDLAVELGIIKKGGKNGYYDTFRGRVMFPIKSHRGDFIGFGGRDITKKENSPKYINSSDSSIFSKGKNLYGLAYSATEIKKQDQVIVVEGYTDFLALYRQGFKNVVANLGTALTSDHAKLLKRYSKNVLLLFDGDEAGQSAAQKSLAIFLDKNVSPRILTLPDNLDPDDFLAKKGAKALQEAIYSAPDLFQQAMNRSFRNYRGDSLEKIRVIDELTPLLNKVQDKRLQDMYLQELADRLQQDISWVKEAFKTPPTKRQAKQTTTQIAPEKDFQLSKASKNEISLLNFALLKDEYFQKLENENVFIDEGVTSAFEKLKELKTQVPFDQMTSVMMELIEPKEVLSLPLSPLWQSWSCDDEKKNFEYELKKAYQRQSKKESRKYIETLKKKEFSENSSEKAILERFVNVQKDRRS